jgi:hypothetical protein
VSTFEYLERLVYYIRLSVLEPLVPMKQTVQAEARSRKSLFTSGGGLKV